MANTKTREREHQYSIDGGNHSHQLPAPASKQSEAYTLQLRELANILGSKFGIGEAELRKGLNWQLARIPYQEREDVLQELALRMLEARPCTAAMAFIIARNHVANWWRHYRAHRLYGDSDITYGSELTDTGEEIIQTIVGEVEWQARIDSELEAKRIFSNLPPRIQGIISKRLAGRRLSGAERVALHRFVNTGHVII